MSAINTYYLKKPPNAYWSISSYTGIVPIRPILLNLPTPGAHLIIEKRQLFAIISYLTIIGVIGIPWAGQDLREAVTISIGESFGQFVSNESAHIVS